MDENTPHGLQKQDDTLANDRKAKLKMQAMIAIGVVLGIVAIVAILVFLVVDPARTANIRDIIIIMVAFVSVLIGALLAVLVFQLQMLIVLLRNEIKPLITTAQQTAQTVRGTTEFVSENLAAPTIKVASFFAGVRGVSQAIRTKANKTLKR
ncbi:MAG: SUR7/PalI family protein [Anaerolineae bacterium]|nr:SUR7/PalI family protein [Anaerolineae bacterium]